MIKYLLSVLFLLFCRCVFNEQRYLSLGVISVITRMFGSIPSPLITGAVFDSICLLCEADDCGLQGNCSAQQLFFGHSNHVYVRHVHDLLNNACLASLIGGPTLIIKSRAE